MAWEAMGFFEGGDRGDGEQPEGTCHPPNPLNRQFDKGCHNFPNLVTYAGTAATRYPRCIGPCWGPQNWVRALPPKGGS